MAKIVDINGNEFKVGCVFEMRGEEREILKIYPDGVITTKPNNPTSTVWWADSLLEFNKARILHYRELAPDKNGKMLCEGDRVMAPFGWGNVVDSFKGLHNGNVLDDDSYDHFVVELAVFPECYRYLKQKEVEFMSRPTDQPAKSAEAIKLEQLIKENEEMQAKLKEALKKAKE